MGNRPTRSGTADEAPVAAGPDVGWEAVVVSYGPRLRRLISRNVPDPQLVDDVLQDALLRSYRSWPTYDRSRPPWPWLSGIARRACASAVETEWRHGRRDRLSTSGVEPGPGSDEHVAQLDRRAAVRAALAALTPRQRRLLLRYEFESVPSAVLAVEERVGTAALTRALGRARARLRGRLSTHVEGAAGAAALVDGLFERLRRRLTPGVQQIGAWSQMSALMAGSLPMVVGVLAGVAPSASAVERSRTVAVSSTIAPGDPGATAAAPTPSTPSGRPQDTAPEAGRIREGDRPGTPVPDQRTPRLAAEAGVGSAGARGGVAVNWTTDDGTRSFGTTVGMTCAHSTVAGTWCRAMGLLPAAVGPVGFSGDGDP